MSSFDDNEKLSDKLARLATEKWPGVLVALGVDGESLVNRHVQCPICSRPHHFRFDNRNGEGTWICVCGAGRGIDLLMKVRKLNFTDAAKEVIAHLGDPEREQRAVQRSKEFVRVAQDLDAGEIERRRALYKRLWQEARRVQEGDPVWKYLTGRIPGLKVLPACVRFHPGLKYTAKTEDGKGSIDMGVHPAMLSAVVGDDGRCCNLHRTFLTRDGQKLAFDREDLKAKKLLPSIGVKSYAVRLAEHRGLLGVSEGIETGFAAMVRTGMPTWALVSTSGMKAFNVPADVRELTIFADNDRRTRDGKRPGFEAAKHLAERADVMERIRAGTLKVKLVAPAKTGHDMDDLHKESLKLQSAMRMHAMA